MSSVTVITAFILDLLIGDPAYSFHPVRLIGNGLIKPIEKRLRRAGMATFGGGFLLLVLTAGISAGAVLGIAHLLQPYPAAYFLFNLYVIYACLAVKDLHDHVEKVRLALKAGDLDRARNCLSSIVGRETAGLDQEAVSRASVETLAENLSDGVIAPLFFAFLGGAPLVVLYKAVNTMDSMVGYKNEQYRKLGFFPAKCDDLLNWIPARLSLLFILLAGVYRVKDRRAAWRIAFRDRSRHTSPNAGHPEAAMAAILNLKLGGPNRYHGSWVEKPHIHTQGNPVTVDDIRSAWRISFVAALLALFFFALIRAFF